MEKIVAYFLGISTVVYIILVGSYLVAHTDTTLKVQPIVVQGDLDLLNSKIYVDTKAGFSLRTPLGWTIDNDRAQKAGALFIAYAGNGSEELRTIKTTKEPFLFSEQKILRGTIADYEYFMKDAKVSSSTLISLHGRYARLFEATVRVGGILYHEYCIVLVKDGYPFVISGAARESLWANYRDQILSSMVTFEVDTVVF
jgi:hypothetical protein